MLTSGQSRPLLKPAVYVGAVGIGMVMVVPIFMLERMTYTSVMTLDETEHVSPVAIALLLTLPSWLGKLCGACWLMRHWQYRLSVISRLHLVFCLCMGVYLGQLFVALLRVPNWHFGLLLHELVQLLGHVVIGVTLGLGIAYWEQHQRRCKVILTLLIPVCIGWTQQVELIPLHQGIAQSLSVPLSQIIERMLIALIYLYISYVGVVKLQPGR